MTEEATLPTEADAVPEGGINLAVEVQSAGVAAAPPPEEKLDQDVVITDAGPCKKHVKVSVARKAIDERFDEKYTEIVRNSHEQIRGFRPGKAPRKIVERRYKAEVQEKVRMEVLMASLEQIASDNAISPLSPPDLDPGSIQMPEDGPLVYEFDVEVRPDFDLPNYRGLVLKRPTKTFTDADIQKQKKDFLAKLGHLEAKGGEAAVEVDDYITADVKVFSDGAELNDLPDMKVKVEKSLALPDGVAEEFGSALAGAKVGDTRSVHIKISEQAANPDLRGKTVKADFTIKKVEVMHVPDVNNDILAGVGVRTPEQFDEFMASVLERQLEYRQRESAREQVFGLITSSTNWELPQDLLARQSKNILARRIMEMRNAGMSDEQIAARQRLMTQDVLQSTAKALKEHFVLQKIADVEKIEIEEADIDDEIERLGERNNESPRKVRARLEREDLIEALATELLERKALDLVLQNATYEDEELKDDGADDYATSGTQALPGEMSKPDETPKEAPKAEGTAEGEAAAPEVPAT